VRINVQAKPTPEQPIQTTSSGVLIEFEFKTESAKKAFDCLLRAFIQDYMRRRLPLEWSGWRTLMKIVRHTGLSKHSVYGDETLRGRAILELENRGLIETRVFPKERGRSGKITKVRIFYEKEIIKRRIDQEISNPNRKNLLASSASN